MGQGKWAEAPVDEDFQRVLAPDGSLLGQASAVSDDELLRWYEVLVLTRTFEDTMVRMQRRGELSVTAQSRGEEAVSLGSAPALKAGDWCFPSYRQNAAHFYWGVPIDRAIAGLMGGAPETIAAHLPVAEPPAVTFAPYAVIVGSNIANAAGSALADQLNGRDSVTLAYTGEGSTSEGDFHEGLNFAAVLQVPLVVIVHNNQWAISTPAHRQSGSRTFAQKAQAYDIPGVRVDGNDVLAVYSATQEAVDRARSGGGPTLIECVTYRVVDHNTSDSSEVYRDQAQAAHWAALDPMTRFDAWLQGRGLLDDDIRARVQQQATEQIEAAAERARGVPQTPPQAMFEHHLGHEDWSLRHQRAELEAELAGRNPFTDFDGEGLA